MLGNAWKPIRGNKKSLLKADDQHRNTNMNDKDHLVGQLTRPMQTRS